MNKTQHSDQQLIAQTLEGCQASYSQLCERHSPTLLLVLQKRCKDHSVCDDVLQDTFMRIYLNLHVYDPQRPFVAWATVIAQHLLIDHHRKADNRPQEQLPSSELAWEGRNPEESFIEQERGARMLEILQQMSSDYRRMIELRFLHDLSYSDIAQKLGLPLGTVKTQIYRARQAFMSTFSGK